MKQIQLILSPTPLLQIIFAIFVLMNASCKSEPTNKKPIVSLPDSSWVAAPAKPIKPTPQPKPLESKDNHSVATEPAAKGGMQGDQSDPVPIQTADRGDLNQRDRAEIVKDPVLEKDEPSARLSEPTLRAVIEGDTLVLTPQMPDKSPSPAKDPTVPEDSGELESIREALEPAPEEADLPDLQGAFRAIEKGTTERISTILIGRWYQAAGNNKADIVEGGYVSSELEFKSTGTVFFRRKFGKEGSFLLERQTDFSFNDEGNLVLGNERPIEDEELIQDTVVIEVGDKNEKVRITPPDKDLPHTFTVELAEDRVKIGDKIYIRIKDDDDSEAEE